MQDMQPMFVNWMHHHCFHAKKVKKKMTLV